MFAIEIRIGRVLDVNAGENVELNAKDKLYTSIKGTRWCSGGSTRLLCERSRVQMPLEPRAFFTRPPCQRVPDPCQRVPEF